MDLTKLKPARTISGLDPEVEALAEKYAKQTWQMDMEAVLLKVLPVEMQDDEFVAHMQDELFKHKYEMLEKASNKKQEAKASGRRW